MSLESGGGNGGREKPKQESVHLNHLRPKEATPKLPAQHDIDLEVNGESVGYAKLVYFSKPVPGYELGMLYIDEDKRGKGYSSALMDKVESMLKQKGKTGILRDGIDVHSPATGMYERRGWIPVPGTENEFVFNLPRGVEPEAFSDYGFRRHTPQRMERLSRRYSALESEAGGNAMDEEERL